MKKFWNYVILYITFAKVNFLSQLEYRGQYFVRMITKTIAWSTGFVSMLIVMSYFDKIGSWSKSEVVFLYALEMLSYSIAATIFIGPFGKLSQLIRSGEFDGILTKPVNPFAYFVCTKTSAGYVNNYVIGLVMIIYALNNLNITITFSKVIWLILIIASGVLIESAGLILTALPAFWIIKTDGMHDLFFTNLTGFLKYPLKIYNTFIQIMLTFIFPYAFINYYPCNLFLGKEEYLFHPIFSYLSPIVGIVLFTISYLLWKLGLRNYGSTGT